MSCLVPSRALRTYVMLCLLQSPLEVLVVQPVDAHGFVRFLYACSLERERGKCKKKNVCKPSAAINITFVALAVESTAHLLSTTVFAAESSCFNVGSAAVDRALSTSEEKWEKGKVNTGRRNKMNG